MEEFIKLIESEFPDFHWLMRSVGGEGETLTGKYFAHIFHPERRDQIGDFEISFRATGMTAKDAIRKAYKQAHKRMMSNSELKPRYAQTEVGMEDLAKVIEWMAGDRDVGMSSKAIASHMSTGKSNGSYPYDPDDLSRCLKLLEKFPEWKTRIGEMGVYSDTWKRYAAHWQELHDSMEAEVGIDWSKGYKAPKTYRLMSGLRA